VDSPILEDAGDGSRHVHEREERCLGEALGEQLEDLLASAHSGEPVVNESEAQEGSSERSVGARPERPTPES
jgi:hypothetical protein